MPSVSMSELPSDWTSWCVFQLFTGTCNRLQQLLGDHRILGHGVTGEGEVIRGVDGSSGYDGRKTNKWKQDGNDREDG